MVAVIAAGGSGARMNSARPKQFLEIGGKPVLLRALEKVAAIRNVRQVVIALPRAHVAEARAIVGKTRWRVPVLCVQGGPTRQESVRRAIGRAAAADLILVHDAVRPFCETSLMIEVLAAAWRYGAAVPAIPVTDTVQRVSKTGRVLATPPREELFSIQTPQCCRSGVLKAALERARTAGFAGTDESSVVRWAGHPVHIVPGAASNIKITLPMDFHIGELILSGADGRTASPQREAAVQRIGHGIDYHTLVEGRPLVLGGVRIPFEKGLQGHSDADALTHAVCDALLGGAALGDIGKHFPDSEPAHRNRPSLEFLREVRSKVEEAGWRIQNVDTTILAQRPRLSPFMEQMRANLAEAMQVPQLCVSVKATTTEGMNSEGRGEGISAQAVALLVRAEPA